MEKDWGVSIYLPVLTYCSIESSTIHVGKHSKYPLFSSNLCVWYPAVATKHSHQWHEPWMSTWFMFGILKIWLMKLHSQYYQRGKKFHPLKQPTRVKDDHCVSINFRGFPVAMRSKNRKKIPRTCVSPPGAKGWCTMDVFLVKNPVLLWKSNIGSVGNYKDVVVFLMAKHRVPETYQMCFRILRQGTRWACNSLQGNITQGTRFFWVIYKTCCKEVLW